MIVIHTKWQPMELLGRCKRKEKMIKKGEKYIAGEKIKRFIGKTKEQPAFVSHKTYRDPPAKMEKREANTMGIT